MRDDGSILYRGPETGQYGRMLTVAALHARYSDDYKGITALAKLRWRVPEGYLLKTVRVDGPDWRGFSLEEQTVVLPAGSAGKIQIEAFYQRN